MGARAVQPVDAGRVGDKDRIGAADEQAAFHHTDDVPDALLQPRRIGDAAEIAIDDAVAAVGDKRLPVGDMTQPGTGAEHLQRRPGCFQPEGDDFDWNRGVRSQPIHQLRPIDDDGEAAARPPQRSSHAATLRRVP